MGSSGGVAAFVIFLLSIVVIFGMSLYAAVTAWSLSQRLSRWAGIPERLLLSLGSFLLVGGCLPLAAVALFALFAGTNPTVGAAGIWAMVGVAAFLGLTLPAIIIAAIRLFSERQSQSGE